MLAHNFLFVFTAYTKEKSKYMLLYCSIIKRTAEENRPVLKLIRNVKMLLCTINFFMWS
jgi:hypothetical protein